MPVDDDGNVISSDESNTNEEVNKKNDKTSKEKPNEGIEDEIKNVKTTWKGVVYDRDPYETDTDQSKDGGSSDLDVDGNIIQGKTRRLTPEEYEEFIINMGGTKSNEDEECDDEESRDCEEHKCIDTSTNVQNEEEEHDNSREEKQIDAIYIEEEINTIEYLDNDYES